jgi:hypothetical protein
VADGETPGGPGHHRADDPLRSLEQLPELQRPAEGGIVQVILDDGITPL